MYALMHTCMHHYGRALLICHAQAPGSRGTGTVLSSQIAHSPSTATRMPSITAQSGSRSAPFGNTNTHTPAPHRLDKHVMWLIDGSLLAVCAQNMVSDGLTMDQTDGTVVRNSVFQDNSDVNLILGGGVDTTVQANTVFMRQSQCGAGNTLSHTNTYVRRRTRTHARACGVSSVHRAAGQS